MDILINLNCLTIPSFSSPPEIMSGLGTSLGGWGFSWGTRLQLKAIVDTFVNQTTRGRAFVGFENPKPFEAEPSRGPWKKAFWSKSFMSQLGAHLGKHEVTLGQLGIYSG